MRTPPDADFDLRGEYKRTLLASRITGTAAILVASVWAGFQHAELWYYQDIFEEFLGGKSRHPMITQSAFRDGPTVKVVTIACVLASLSFIWIIRGRISRVLYGALAGVLVAVLAGLFFQIGYRLPLRELTDHLRR